MDGHHASAVPRGQKNRASYPSRIKAIDGCELPCRWWEPNLVLSKEQQVSLTTESSLQPLTPHLSTGYLVFLLCTQQPSLIFLFTVLTVFSWTKFFSSINSILSDFSFYWALLDPVNSQISFWKFRRFLHHTRIQNLPSMGLGLVKVYHFPILITIFHRVVPSKVTGLERELSC